MYRSRMAMGDALAEEVERVLKEKGLSVDVVITVSSRLSSSWSISVCVLARDTDLLVGALGT